MWNDDQVTYRSKIWTSLYRRKRALEVLPIPVKINQHSNPSLDTLRLFCLLLYSGKEFSLRQLADHFSCTKQTILRRIDTLNHIDYSLPEPPIVVERREKQNYYRLKMPNAVKARENRNHEELEYLTCCRELAGRFLPPGCCGKLISGLKYWNL